MIEKITFESLPLAVTMLTNKVNELKEMLLEDRASNSVEESERFLNIQEASKFLNLAKPTLYTKVSKREIPFMKRGKRLYFSKSELMDYIKEGRKQSISEINAEAETYLSNNKKGLK